MKRLLLILTLLLTGFAAWAQKPGTTPIKLSQEKQMVNGRKYYVHIVEKGQTVYSIARAYRVESFDAVTHVDIHALHPGDTVWLPFRGQFTESEEREAAKVAAPPVAPTIRVDTVHVHDTTVVTKTVKQTEYVTVRDTAYITVRDTTYINVPYAVHDTMVVTDTVTLTKKEYVTVHDTSYVYVNNTNTVTDTVTLTQKEYVTVRDTIYVKVHDTVHDTAIVVDTVTIAQKVFVPVHDTTYVYVNNTNTVTDTLTLTQKEYVPVHDTTYVYVNNTNTVTDTVTLTQKEYVTVLDTIYVKVPYTVHDTAIVVDTVTLTQKEYVPVHDTTYVYVNNTKVVTDTVKVKEYVTVRDTAYITLRDTTILRDTVTLTRTEYVKVHDTTYITVHDTTVIIDTIDISPAPSYDLALASNSAVAMTGYLPSTAPAGSPSQAAAPQRKAGKSLKVALMMPLHLDQMEQISTSKFDIEQRGKRTYRQFEFIEFYEGVLLALDRLAEQGVSVELNVVDVSENSAAKVEEAFTSHHVDRSNVVIALLLRDAFDKAAELSQKAGVYIVNPMSTRSELCAENPYMVKVQPSLAGQIALMLDNMKLERPDAHLYIIHSNAKAEKAAMDELKRQLTERGDIKYTIFNWSQNAKLATVLKATPSCNVVSIYDQGRDNNRVYTINLLNRLASIKKNSPVLYSFTDWTREYNDIDFNQLQLLGYHTFSQNWDMTNEVHVQFLQAFRTRFGAEPTTPLAATAHDLILYVVGGLAKHNSGFWQQPGPSLPTLLQPLHLIRQGAGLENDRAQLYRMENMRFVKALYR